MDARVRARDTPEGLAFDSSAEKLGQSALLNLTTRYGDVDLAMAPTGTGGYDELRREALELEIHGTHVVVAALADVIRSKEAAGREKDRLTLPNLRTLLRELDRSSPRK